MHGWQANLKRTCALPVLFRALPENEIPPAWRVDIYFWNRVASYMILSHSSLMNHSPASLVLRKDFCPLSLPLAKKTAFPSPSRSACHLSQRARHDLLRPVSRGEFLLPSLAHRRAGGLLPPRFSYGDFSSSQTRYFVFQSKTAGLPAVLVLKNQWIFAAIFSSSSVCFRTFS